MQATRIRPLFAVCCAALVLGCAGRALPPPPDPDPMDKETYVIGAADQLLIRVWKNPELSVGVPVRTDGKISVPLLDDIQAEGLTPETLKDVIAQRLAEYIENPEVTVIVTSAASKRIYVMGAVQRPGPQALATEMRVLDALAAAAGFTQFASKGSVRIIRRAENGGTNEYRFDYDAFLDGDPAAGNLMLRPGDTIVVPD